MSDSADGGSPGRRRRWPSRIGAAVLVALAASLLTTVVHRQVTADEIEPPAIADDVASIGIPRSGMVVSLTRPGFVDLPARVGLENAFVASTVAAGDIAAVELLAGSAVVARAIPAARGTTGTQRLVWTPDRTGPVTLVARAYGEDGQVGLSNPVRVVAAEPVPAVGLATVATGDGETLGGLAARLGANSREIAERNGLGDVALDAPLPPGTELEIPLAAPGPESSVAPGVALPGRGRARPTQGGTPLPPLPASIDPVPAPVVQAVADGCGVTVEATTDDDGQTLFLLHAPPAGSAFVPVAALPPGPVVVPASSGIHDFVVGAAEGGSLVAWSDPVTVPVDDEACSGWEGTARLDGSTLQVAGEAEQAYLYLSTASQAWVRVPESGFVPRGIDGFDFAGLLPPMAGSSLALEAWGRDGGALVPLGTGRFTPPAPPASGGVQVLEGGPTLGIGGAIAFPTAQLRWLRPPDWDEAGDPPQALTSGFVPEPKPLQFQWNAPIPGVTHGIVQVTSSAVPLGAGPAPGGVLRQLVVPGHAGTFEIDFQQVVDAYYALQSGTLLSASDAFADQSYQVFAGVLLGDTGATTTTGVPLSPHPLDLDPTDDFDVEALGEHFFVRVVPMVADTWTGLVTNDVDLEVDPSGLFPVAPAGERPYDLDVALTQPPRPPNPSRMSCWQFTGWSDEAAVQQALAAEASAGQGIYGTYTLWSAMVAMLGSEPICAGCYHLGSTTVALAGSTCADNSLIGDLFEAFQTFVDMLSSTFAFIKAQIVELAVSASGCTALGDTAASVCSTLATVALDAALASFGIPPSLPNWDQLVAAAEGEIVEVGVQLATQAGVPCDEADFATEIHGSDVLSCEGVIEAFLGEVQAQIDDLYADTAASMGFGFPPLMTVRPHPSGQVGPAAVTITVNPTQYSAAESGETCNVGAYPSSAWAGTIDPVATAALGAQVGGPIVSGLVPGTYPGSFTGPTRIPQLSWSGSPFEANFWTLPDLPKKAGTLNQYLPASRTYQLYPPLAYDPVAVSELLASTQPSQPVTQFWHQWPRQVFLLNSGSLFKLVITSGCATGTGLHAWILPGFGPGPAAQVAG